jgi:hypothetical protein
MRCPPRARRRGPKRHPRRRARSRLPWSVGRIITALSPRRGAFGRKLERKAVHPPQYRLGVMLCSLEPAAKFLLFLHDSADPVSVLAAGFNAGLDQASDRDPSFGQGATGYGRRFASNFAGQTASRFFGDFLYPTIFAEDPRYYRMAHGCTTARLFRAMSHTVVARRDNGTAPLTCFRTWDSTCCASSGRRWLAS